MAINPWGRGRFADVPDLAGSPFQLSQRGLKDRQKRREVLGNGGLDDIQIHIELSVDQPVSHRNHFRVRDAREAKARSLA